MGQDVTNQTRFCQKPQGSKKGLSRHLKPRTILMAVGLSLILTTTGLVYFWMLKPLPFIPYEDPIVRTPHSAIKIDGDANFSDTALLEGWPGDGSPENPFIINGLEIDLGFEGSHGIIICDTRVSFIISNCNLTRASPSSFGFNEAGIYLENVMNGELVGNIFDSNYNGIILYGSDYNTVACNNGSSNTNYGILLHGSDYNTVTNNTCSNNGEYGIALYESHSNTVTNNTCNKNVATPGAHHGISLYESHSNTVSDNTCNNNGIGIYLKDSVSNALVNNTCLGNTEHDIFEEFLSPDAEFDPEEDYEIPEVLWLNGATGYIGFMVITLLGGLIMGNRVSKGE